MKKSIISIIEYSAIALAVCFVLYLLFGQPKPAFNGVIAAYTTDLSMRTPHQRFNARRAAASLNNVVIPASGEFSFNSAVQGWTAGQGFLRAPVSYDGILIDDYGGGVCETSTTLYNAALLAGMIILERHPHSFYPSYAPPGRDAAVAYPSVDLRFKNPYPWPVTIKIDADNRRMVCRLIAPKPVHDRVTLESRVMDRIKPADVSTTPGNGLNRSQWQVMGRDGIRVAVFRKTYGTSGDSRHEQISDDTYLPISRVKWDSQR